MYRMTVCKIDKMAIKCTYVHLPLHHPPKFTIIGIFGLEIYPLAILPGTTVMNLYSQIIRKAIG
jgi:hypothetical protein